MDGEAAPQPRGQLLGLHRCTGTRGREGVRPAGWGPQARKAPPKHHLAGKKSTIRVDVAIGELHVAALDQEAAALPEEWRLHSKGSRKVLRIGAMDLGRGWCGVLSAFERGGSTHRLPHRHAGMGRSRGARDDYETTYIRDAGMG